MKNLSIRKKLFLTFGIILALYAGSLLFSLLLGMQTVTSSFQEFYNGPHQVVYTAVDLRRALQILEKDMLHMFLEDNQSEREPYKEEMEAAAADVSSDISFLQENLTLQENRDRLTTIIDRQTKMITSRTQIMEYIEKNDLDNALNIYESQYSPMAEEIRDLSVELSNTAQAVGDDYFTDAETTQFNVTIIVTIYFILSMAIAIALCIYIIRSITKPLTEIESAAKLVANGKLNADIQYTSKDEIGSLANSIRALIVNLNNYISDISYVLGRMSEGDMAVSVDMDYQNDFAPIKDSMIHIIEALNDTLDQISTSSQQVAAGSEQMSAGAQSLSQGASEQASSAEELAASISEIAERVKENTNGAHQASLNMKETTHSIHLGNEQMQKLVKAMNEIAATSSEIQKIIKTIEDIAFQTNILSLNAAVEAARAGSAGRGFAIVADEVRNLANKSAEAAKDTTTLIQTTISAINNGNKMVIEAEKSLNEISEKAENVAELVQNIASASEAQSHSIEQINIGVNQISSVIQTNSATAEESAASSEELSAQAEMLQTLVSQFQLKKYTVPGRQAVQPEEEQQEDSEKY